MEPHIGETRKTVICGLRRANYFKYLCSAGPVNFSSNLSIPLGQRFFILAHPIVFFLYRSGQSDLPIFFVKVFLRSYFLTWIIIFYNCLESYFFNQILCASLFATHCFFFFSFVTLFQFTFLIRCLILLCLWYCCCCYVPHFFVHHLFTFSCKIPS
jgi:hypothetical protein